MTQAKNTFFIGTFAAIAIGSAFMTPAHAESPLRATVNTSRLSANVIPDAVVKNEKLIHVANLSYQVAGKRYYPKKEVRAFAQTGPASWYGSKFHGRKTTSGERYDMNIMTAAHKTLPIPSYARVTNLSNGKSVVVRINDRGPFHSNRVMDVSRAAAQKLGFIRQGTAKVRIEQILPGKQNQQAAKTAPEPNGNIYVNLKSFANERDARAYLKQTNAQVQKADAGHKVLLVKQRNQYVVRMGPFNNQNNANNMKRQVQTAI